MVYEVVIVIFADPPKIKAVLRVNIIILPCVKCGGALVFDQLLGQKPEPDMAYICKECLEKS